jgi:hypothetical protein
MDGRIRATDNIYIERFWRSIKQEKIYLTATKQERNYMRNYGRILIFTTIKDHIKVLIINILKYFMKKVCGYDYKFVKFL